MKPLSRQEFLRKGSIALAGIPFLSLMSCKEKNPMINCRTEADILGPFYRADAPFREALNVLNEAGTPIVIQGKVFGGETCTEPLAQAIVDVWHADDDGAYDNDTSDFKYRGRIETDADGTYSFMSIRPGAYLNGNQFRPRHIHYRVTAAGHGEVVTQLYFEGDEFIADDPWASVAEGDRIIVLEEVQGVLTGTFDVNLPVA